MKFQQRGFASLLMTLSFLVATISGVVLYLAPRGRTANWTGWSMLGFDRNQWIAVHINISLLVLLVAALHLYLNWSVFRSYVKRMATRGVQVKHESILAVLFTALVVAGASLDLPPFRAVTSYRYRYQMKAHWEQETATQPLEDRSIESTWDRGQGRGPRWARD